MSLRCSGMPLLAAIVCYWLLAVPPVTPVTPPRDRPVVYPSETLQEKSNQIPEALLIQMKDIQNLTQLLDFLGAPEKSGIGGPRPINGSAEEAPSGSESSNSTGVDRRKLSGGMEVSRAAGCEPEQQTVELEKPEDATHVYWPMCIRVARCGGCCTSNLLKCVPVKTSKIEAKVLHAQYLGGEVGGQFDVVGFLSLKVEKHEKCSCQCRERAEDCNELQVYKQEECRCMCTDDLAREKCTGPKWIWDPKDCACKCRQIDECSTGFIFNGISCRCEAQRSSLVGRRLIANVSSLSHSALNLDVSASQIDAVKRNLTENETTVSTTASTKTTTTTTQRPRARVRSRLGLPVDERVHYKAPHVGIRPTDYEDDAPFTLARSNGKSKARRIEEERANSNETGSVE